MAWKIGFAAALAALVAGGAGAVTLTEPGGAGFSNSHRQPTAVAGDVTAIEGRARRNDADFFALEGVDRLEISVFALGPVGYSYAAGGVVKLAEDPFRWRWDGETQGSLVLNWQQTEDSLVIDLPQDSTVATRYLGLYFTHGRDIGYRIGLGRPGGGDLGGGGLGGPVAAPGAEVPLPPAALLLGGALLAIGWLGRSPVATA
ncbi:MAG: hypothetical protein AAFV86_21820 [Pseudomonadota bacterium]